MRCTYVLLIGLGFLVVAPAPALAWWDFIEQFSGPRKFWGPDIQLRLFCVVETTKQVTRFVPDPNFVPDATKKQTPPQVIQASDERVTEGRAAAPVGVMLSLCRVDPSKDEKQRLMFDLGARFMKSGRYEGDPTPDFANGETIHFTTLETATPKRLATTRQLAPSRTAVTTRSRRSVERGLAIDAGLPSSIDLESHPSAQGNPSRFRKERNRS